ncbi:helix-turn-helix transcriptional regulator [Flagellimonas hymeniacidonis]|uniref:Helix-turn-helix transcriptional regulator n=1 Tax=Flagellimonas hymeniacidonis TaxID=2603628 RepID=A0A5C8V4X4_9FLAO|nr:helix-turn-helix transcriptional regulator [Flagellimonas hymeniacidonis]TXN36085.1 helix-turn-helix transcriptional regulator [Flagellimonas hymeniacidonis]
MEKKGNEQLLTNLAKRVKELRKNKGVTQEDALNDTGIQFSRIEQGKRDVQLSTLHKICEYFEISLKEFFDTSF